MSYDRVLPKPAALHYDCQQITLPRKSSNLLEHKIMNDAVSKVVEHAPVEASCRYAADTRMNEVAPVHLSSLNRAKFAVNKIPSNSLSSVESESVTPLRTKDIPIRDRSPSSVSPVKPVVLKESGIPFCLCQPDPKIPRPRNAFILYRQHHQSTVVAQNPGLANPEISKIIGDQWNNLPEETKKEWRALAEEEKARHQQQYPDYRYQPRRYGRDGSSRITGAGISHNPPGSTVCSRCGGRIMNPPATPETPFTPKGRSSFSAASTHSNPTTTTVRSYQCREKDPARAPSPIKIHANVDSKQSRSRQWEDTNLRSPEFKRRRFNNAQLVLRGNGHRDKSPDTAYPASPYTPRADMTHNPRGFLQPLHPPKPYRNVKEHPTHQDPSLRLPPLQTAAAAGHPGTASGSTPATPFLRDGSSLEATVMTIPVLNKIKLLAKISPPLEPSFRATSPVSQPRGAVIAVDGQDPVLVKSMVEYLETVLAKEGKYNVRTFEGPEIRSRQASPESGQMGDVTVDYLNTISAWHRISDEIVSFVKGASAFTRDSQSQSPDAMPVDEEPSSGVSPKSIIPRTARLQISSPDTSTGEITGDNISIGSGSAATTITRPSPGPSAIPIALIPRYQLTTADAFACSIPIRDSYAPLDHWQWMASLWRACVGPDVTVYIRDCEKDENERYGGNSVEVRLHDARTVVVRRSAGSPLEEKLLKRVGFEVEDFLTQ